MLDLAYKDHYGGEARPRGSEIRRGLSNQPLGRLTRAHDWRPLGRTPTEFGPLPELDTDRYLTTPVTAPAWSSRTAAR